MAQKRDTPKSAQREKFSAAARELGCNPDEARFEEKLKQVARKQPSRELPERRVKKKNAI